MESTVAVMAAVNLDQPDLLEHVNKIAERFERLNDIPVRIITDADIAELPLAAPHFARYYAWQFVPETAERIIYLDYDILPVRPLPETMPKADLAAIRETTVMATATSKTFPIIKDAEYYFNSGLLIAKRKTKLLFDRMIARQARTPFAGSFDQTLLNVETQLAISMEEITFELIPNDWCMAFWDLQAGSDPCMVHYLALSSTTKARAVGALVEAFNSAEHALRGE